MSPKNCRMPGREIKQSYPPCNRAFALRMMNPTSYTEERVSPLDREIQPVVKKPIAKGVFEDRRYSDTYSIEEENSLSPTSSTASMELYDIEEIEHELNGGMVRQHSSLESYTRQKRNSKTSSVGSEDIYMMRSYSSSDGFDGKFQRGGVGRLSTPARMRSNSTPKQPRSHGTTLVNGHAQVNGNSGKNGSSLRRTQSLRERPNSTTPTGSPQNQRKNAENGRKSKQPAKILVFSTKSSQLRAQLHDSNSPKTASRSKSISTTKVTPKGVKTPKSNINHKVRKQKQVSDELSESDSSINTIYSEIDSYNPRHNPRHRSSNGISSRQNSLRQRHYSSDQSSEADSPLLISSPSTPSNKPYNLEMASAPLQLPKNDTFSSKLAEVCHLISERHPGDFQILETLVEMQTAYDERNNLVKQTISNLRQKIRNLEYKVSNSTNIPGLVIPLMRATTAFQNQLQSIMDSQDPVRGTQDASVQFPADDKKDITLDEISIEANNVAAELEKHGNSNRSSVENKENIHNRKTSDSLDAYAIISEVPVTV